jgi:two-component system, NtrC family, sensor kinase
MHMNIAFVGGGTQCRHLFELIERHGFGALNPKVVALADERDDAPCVPMAKAKGLFVTTDYNEILKRDDIDLIIELTGKEEVFYDILSKKKKTVRAFDHRTAQLFWEVSNRASDIKEKADRELSKTRSAFEAVINELIQEDVMIISPTYKILAVNETAAKKQGLRREEIIGRYCYEISHQEQVPCEGENHPCPLNEALKTGRPTRATHIHLDKDKNELLYAISCYPIVENGKIVAVIEISKDITKDVGFQKVLVQQEKMASIGRLAAGVAHEINNPMTTILTTAMLLQEDLEPDNPMFAELQTIADETIRCRRIVTSLLDFARQTVPAKKKQDINEIVRETMMLTKKHAAFKDVGMAYELADDLPLVYVDKDQIQQSLINLSLNAIDATEPSGRVTLVTRRADEGGVVEIDVKDTGKGIAQGDMDKIFEPFFTTKETGTGLGLAITHGFIERHGGTIRVESEIGRGTTFTIKLPVKEKNSDANR